MKDIVITNRDGQTIRFSHFTENEYHFVPVGDGSIRVSHTDIRDDDGNETFNMIDPSGGPYISVGGRLADSNKIVSRISWDKINKYYIIRTEN